MHTNRMDETPTAVRPATPPRTASFSVYALVFNVACPFVFKEMVNHFIIPSVNRYFAQIDILGISPLPPLHKLDTLTAFVLVALTSLRFVPLWW